MEIIKQNVELGDLEAQVNENMGTSGPRTRSLLYRMYKKRCAYCGCELTLKSFTVDHFFPKSKGGKASLKNIKPSCGFCNNLKANMTVGEFRKLLSSEIDNGTDVGNKIKNKYKLVDNKIKFHFETLNESVGKCVKTLRLLD